MNRNDIARDNKARWDVLHPFDSKLSAFVWASAALVVAMAALYLLT